jgi:hypothetical protein
LVQVDTLELRPLPGVVIKQFTAREGVSRWDVVEARSRATATTVYEGAHKTSFLTQAPAQTEGVARVWAGQCRLKGVKAFTVLGAEVPLVSHRESDTVLLRYANDAHGVVVRVEWNFGKTGK